MARRTPSFPKLPVALLMTAVALMPASAAIAGINCNVDVVQVKQWMKDSGWVGADIRLPNGTTATWILCSAEAKPPESGIVEPVSPEACQNIQRLLLTAQLTGKKINVRFKNSVPEDPVRGNGNGTVQFCTEVVSGSPQLRSHLENMTLRQ